MDQNEVGLNFLPRVVFHRFERQFTEIRSCRYTDALANVASLAVGFDLTLHIGKVKVSIDGVKHTEETRMIEQRMIPIDDLLTERLRDSNFPFVLRMLGEARLN